MEQSISSTDLHFRESLDAKIRQATQIIAPRLQWRLLIATLLIVDTLFVASAFRLAYFFRFELSLPLFYIHPETPLPFYETLSFLLSPAWLLIFALNGLYQRRHLLGGIQEYDRVFRAVTLGMLLVILVSFLEPLFVFARAWLLFSWFFAFVGVAAGRFWIRRAVYRLREHGYFLSPALIVGANEEGRLLAQQLLGWRTSGLHVQGFIDNEFASGALVGNQLKVLGGVDQLDQLIKKHNIEELILATSALSRNEIVSIFTRYGLVDGLNLRLSSGLFEIITTGLEVKELAFVPLVRVNQIRMTGAERVMKFILDYAITLPGLIGITPLLLLIALAIKLDSPGPAIYRRRVMGLNGRQFDAFKFRTMRVNGDEILDQHPELKAELQRNHKLKNDPRITRVGAFLRKYSLDELPQLFNVLKREMSLVGPRMISPEEMEMYQKWGMNLLTVPPGISGLWQVSGRSDISYGERVNLDMQYIRNWTIWLDLQLLIQTIPAVLKKRGAY